MAIAVATFQSAGQQTQHVIPGAYSRIDIVAGASGFVSIGNTVIIGSAQGGQPQTLLQFNNQSQALDALIGGPVYEAMRHAFNPGPGVRPQRIFGMRINNATRSSYNLEVTPSGGSAADTITLRSRDYGTRANQIQVQVTANASASYAGRNITIQFRDQSETYSAVERGILEITGASTTSLTVTATNIVGADTTTPANAFSLRYVDFDTVGDLVAALDGQAGISDVSVVAGAENIRLLNRSNYLDFISTGLALDTERTITANTSEVIETINRESAFVTAERVSTEDPGQTLTVVASLDFFSGANAGDYNTTQATAALTALEAEDIQIVTTPDPDDAAANVPSVAGIHVLIKNHCERMSATTGRRERQFVVGGPWGETIANAIASSRTLNSYLGMYVFNGFVDRDALGELQNWGASYAACKVAGLASVLAINEPLTFKQLSAISLENALNNSQLEMLIRNNVAPVSYNDDGVPHFVRQVNTYQAANKIYNEFSAIREALFASRDLRTFLQSRITGRPGTTVTRGIINGLILNRLQRYVDLGIFIGDQNNPAYSDVSVQLEADVYRVDYDANLTLPVNFTFVTSHFREFISTAETL